MKFWCHCYDSRSCERDRRDNVLPDVSRTRLEFVFSEVILVSQNRNLNLVTYLKHFSRVSCPTLDFQLILHAGFPSMRSAISGITTRPPFTEMSIVSAINAQEFEGSNYTLPGDMDVPCVTLAAFIQRISIILRDRIQIPDFVCPCMQSCTLLESWLFRHKNDMAEPVA